MTEIEHAGDRLHRVRFEFDLAVRGLMDSITGAWDCEGRPAVPEVCSAISTIVSELGRLGHTIEKAAMDIYARAGDCYLDYQGSTTDATADVQEIAQGLVEMARPLRTFEEDHYQAIRHLGNIGERG